MSTKKINVSYSNYNTTLYVLIKRESDGYYMNNVDGSFYTLPIADMYLQLIEDSIVKGLYKQTESRTAWTDGEYTIIAYEQIGGSPSLSNDILVGINSMYVKDDSEQNINPKIIEIFELYGLDSNKPLVVSTTQRTTGDISQTITTDENGTTTVVRI